MSSPIKNIFQLGFPWQTEDPFLFCVYHLDHYPKGNAQMEPSVSLEGRSLGNDFVGKDGWRMYHGQTIPGFPAHPHRGFETITIVNKGFCDHSDSLGAAGRFGEGDVQWMTAGSGVQHSEMFPLLHTDKENPLELFQIWLNLPKVNKFVAPHFKMLWHEDIPVIQNQDSSIKVIAGNFNEINALTPAPNSWASNQENELAIWNIHMEPQAELTLPITIGNVHRTIYYYEGDEVFIGEKVLAPNHGATLNSQSKTTLINGDKTSHFLILQGKPINEPVVKHGPFVMNTDAEIQNAMNEYRLTQYGGWPWQHSDNVHPKEKGRFAKYPDGTLVEK
ncbi:MAG: pirin [Flavobacteriaceae bacterium]|nr:MAG: pirin [Flavobacteriaceae bacterium]